MYLGISISISVYISKVDEKEVMNLTKGGGAWKVLEGERRK